MESFIAYVKAHHTITQSEGFATAPSLTLIQSPTNPPACHPSSYGPTRRRLMAGGASSKMQMGVKLEAPPTPNLLECGHHRANPDPSENWLPASCRPQERKRRGTLAAPSAHKNGRQDRREMRQRKHWPSSRRQCWH